MDYIRKKVRLLKAMQPEITYKELAELIDIKQSSFYSWLKGYYSLSYEKEKQLAEIIDILRTEV